jgi:predicted acyltransferase
MSSASPEAVRGPAGSPVGPAGRLVSLDVFRGATIAAMILVNNPGNWGAIYPPLRHAEWNGWTFTDLVFPFFLWIVGVAATLSFAKRAEHGDSRRRLLLHTLRRAAIIFALGLILNGFPSLSLATWRIPGVLQRIAVCYLIAGTIYLFTTWRGQAIWTLGLLAAYWMLMTLVPVPGGGGGFDKGANLARYVDGLVLGNHMWAQTRTWDPEGLLSTLPAIATTLFGLLTGRLLRSALTAAEKTVWLFFGGNVLVFTGLVMNVWMPINKNLWTSSFAVFMAGMASIVFACCYWLIDVKGYRGWARPFAIYGMNAIALYVLSGALEILPDTVQVGRVSLHQYLFRNLFASWASPVNASLLWAVCCVLGIYAVAYGMYRRRWFIRV